LGFGYYIYGYFNSDIGIFEFFVMALAVFRLTQLFVYDQVMRFVRDLFSDVEEIEEDGVLKTFIKKPKVGFRRSMFELLECPWCVGMWMALLVVFTQILLPGFFYLWLVLALAGVGSVIQILIHKFEKKVETEK
jgi:hypothetical protein